MQKKYPWAPKLSEAKTKHEVWRALVMETGPVTSFYYRTPTISDRHLKMKAIKSLNPKLVDKFKYLDSITLPLSKEVEFADILEVTRKDQVLTQEQVEKLKSIKEQHDQEFKEKYHRILKEKRLE